MHLEKISLNSLNQKKENLIQVNIQKNLVLLWKGGRKQTRKQFTA